MKLSLFYVIIFIVGVNMKKHIKFIMIFLVLLVSIFSIDRISSVKADSGWDSSYSSGGSSWGGSSYSGGSDWDFGGSSSRRSSGPIRKLTKDEQRRNLIIFITVIGTVIVIIILINNKAKRIVEKEKNKYKEISDEELKKYFDKNLIELKKELYDKFIKIQEAWMNFDYDTLKETCSNEIYNTYYEELEALKLKNCQNIMSDFEKIDDRIISIKEENNNIIVEYYLKLFFYDYVINTETGERSKGSKLYRLNNTYIIKFIISKDKFKNNCPNCGGIINAGTTTCEHCKAVIVQNSSEFVMTSKRRV